MVIAVIGCLLTNQYEAMLICYVGKTLGDMIAFFITMTFLRGQLLKQLRMMPFFLRLKKVAYFHPWMLSTLMRIC